MEMRKVKPFAALKALILRYSVAERSLLQPSLSHPLSPFISYLVLLFF